MFIQLNNHKAHIYNKNPIDSSKKSIVFLPGAGMDHRTLSMFKLSKIESEYNLIAIDLPGHGYTSGPFFLMLKNIVGSVEVFERMELNNPIIIGHSWGGLIALDLSTKFNSEMTICMNIAYPFLVGEMLLDFAKGNLDQAVEFLTKYGVYKFPDVEIKTQGFGVKGSGFMEDLKAKLNHPMVLKLLKLILKEK